MNDVQSLFNQLQEAKREQKEIRKEYRDTLKQNTAYEEITEELKALREKKKLIETEVQAQMGSRWEQLENLKIDVEETQEMISDAAVSMLMKGESVAIKDEHDIDYEPRFSVSFKKIQ